MAGGLGISPDLLEGAEPSVAAPLLAGDLDDGLMSRARDTGKFLYKNLEPQERVEKINVMVREKKFLILNSPYSVICKVYLNKTLCILITN